MSNNTDSVEVWCYVRGVTMHVASMEMPDEVSMTVAGL